MAHRNLFRALLPRLAYTILLGALIASLLYPSHTSASASGTGCAEEPDLGRFFKDFEGTFVFMDAQTFQTVCRNPERARRRFLPASTYKMPNTFIALETGDVQGHGNHLEMVGHNTERSRS